MGWQPRGQQPREWYSGWFNTDVSSRRGRLYGDRMLNLSFFRLRQTSNISSFLQLDAYILEQDGSLTQKYGMQICTSFYYVPTIITHPISVPITYNLTTGSETFAGEWDTFNTKAIGKYETAVMWNIWSCFPADTRKSSIWCSTWFSRHLLTNFGTSIWSYARI